MDKISISGRLFAILPSAEIGKFCINLDTVVLVLKNGEGKSRLYTKNDERVYDVPIEFDSLVEFLSDKNLLDVFKQTNSSIFKD